MRRFALLAAALLFASCNGAPTLSEGQLRFTSGEAAATPDPQAPEVTGLGGTIHVIGRFHSRCLGGTLNGGLVDGSRAITLVVDWEEPSGCFAAIGKHDYQAVIAGLEPRDYRVRVLHRGEAGSGDRVVFDGTVSVRHPNLR